MTDYRPALITAPDMVKRCAGEREEWVSSVSVNEHGLDRLEHEYSYAKFFVGNHCGAADEATVATKTTTRRSYR